MITTVDLTERVLGVMQVVTDLLVLSGEEGVLFPCFVELVSELLDLLLLCPVVPLRGFVQSCELIQLGLEVSIEALKLVNALLQFASSSVGLK
jgi:hypothetical protein